MAEKGKERIQIDLNQFKLHINIEHKIELSLHFDSPSRRFYLAVMAFVVAEMQKLGRITSIPLEEHYELLALQDRITGKIVAALAVKLKAGEEVHIAHKKTDNIAAYDSFLQGWAHYVRCTPDDYAKAIPYFEKAVELDPHYGRAHAVLASIYWESFYRLWHASLGVSWRETKLRADTYLKTAMESPTPLAYLVASKMLIGSFEHEKSARKQSRQ